MFEWLSLPRAAYIHIPFCERKCGYCDFNSYAGKEKYIEPYVDALVNEIRFNFWKMLRAFGSSIPLSELNFGSEGFSSFDMALRTVYFGGGTPSLLSAQQIGEIIDVLRHTFGLTPNCEITLEANPSSASALDWSEVKRFGINRVSVGLQSYNDRLLNVLGRIHTCRDFDYTTAALQRAGLENISCDLMIGLPTQSLADIHMSLEHVIKSGYRHISVYSLIIEPGTPFASLYGTDTPDGPPDSKSNLATSAALAVLPDETTERQQQHFVSDYLKDHGFSRYEVSNYAQEGSRSKHNIVYWDGLGYYGFGAGAHRFVGGIRSGSEINPLKYISNFSDSKVPTKLDYPIEEIISRRAAMSEFFVLGLRKTDGVSRQEFVHRFGCDIPLNLRVKLDELRGKGLLIAEAGGWRLSDFGLDVANIVWEEFL